MGLFEIFAVLLTLAALFAWVNHKFLRLPTTIGLMILALLLSLGMIWAGRHWPGVAELAGGLLAAIDFDDALMHGMLGFLLFAGALHVELNDLREQKGVIAVLATAGVLISTFLVAWLSWLVLNSLLGLGVPFLYCLLFGALISPTDPIAVMGILKSLGAPRSLETKITGESLFNDGIGVVVFLAVAGAIGFGHGASGPDAAHAAVSAGDLGRLFLTEAVGGAILGLGLGLLVYWMLRSVDSYQVEVLLSLALVAGGYGLCDRLGASGPIAMVVAGLLIGNQGRAFAMSDTTREHLDAFWELIDEILNAVLFVMIGLEILILTFRREYVVAGLLMIPAVLAARWVAVGVPITLLRLRREFTPHAIKILTWGGLRGGISVALALSIPRRLHGEPVPEREVLVFVTYLIVVFSIIVQGLSIGPLVRRVLGSGRKA